ncbi:hypothetical protein TNCV_2063771 [Trichonephila clavipes]|nr:hypothetical protein TNCV_2063771 [Trichonephila clavipes]
MMALCLPDIAQRMPLGYFQRCKTSCPQYTNKKKISDRVAQDRPLLLKEKPECTGSTKCPFGGVPANVLLPNHRPQHINPPRLPPHKLIEFRNPRT